MIQELFARQRAVEERLTMSETKLASSIDQLTKVVDNLNSKLETFVELHQNFVMKILIILSCVFLGKEFLQAVIQKMLQMES
jgi:Mg2+ and Co2+ transporter CorA